MKNLLITILLFYPLLAGAQETLKHGNIYYNEITEIDGSDYVYAGVRDMGKKGARNKYMLFVNTMTGEQRQIDFPKDAYVDAAVQVKIDSLDINVLIVTARTVNLDNSKTGIDWQDPKQIFVLSVDGKKKTQVTDDNYYVNTFKVVRRTGALVITGYFDNNSNQKYDKGDVSKVLTFSLKTMTKLGKSQN